MKAHIITILCVDHEEIGLDGSADLIKDSRYLFAQVVTKRTIEIGEWTDDHPTNKRGTDLAAWVAEQDAAPDSEALPAGTCWVCEHDDELDVEGCAAWKANAIVGKWAATNCTIGIGRQDGVNYPPRDHTGPPCPGFKAPE